MKNVTHEITFWRSGNIQRHTQRVYGQHDLMHIIREITKDGYTHFQVTIYKNIPE